MSAKLSKTQVNKLVSAARTAIGNADKAQMPVVEVFAQLYNGHARYIEKSADFTDFWRNTVGVSSDTFKLARASRQALMIATPDASQAQHLAMTGASVGTVSQERAALSEAGKAKFTDAATGRPRTEEIRSPEEIKRDRTARLLKSLPAGMQDEVVATALTRSPEKRTDVTVTPADETDSVRMARLVAELVALSAGDYETVIRDASAKRESAKPNLRVTQLPKQRAPKQTSGRKTSRTPAKVS